MSASTTARVLPDEQAAFEEWLRETRPSGCVERVQHQWSQSSEYQDFLDDQRAAIAEIAGVPNSELKKADPMTNQTPNDAHGRDLVAYELTVSNLRAELAAENQAAGYWMREANASHNQNERLTAERDEYQRAADDMAAKHKVERDALAERVKALEADQVRLEFVLNEGAFIVSSVTDAGAKTYQLCNQDENENYTILHGASSFYPSPRAAIDAAIKGATT